MNNALTASFPAGVAPPACSRALGSLWLPWAVFGSAPLRVRSPVPLTPVPSLVATQAEKILERGHCPTVGLSGRTLFPSETLPERNLRASHSPHRPYGKARRGKPVVTQTSDSPSTKLGCNFHLEQCGPGLEPFGNLTYWGSLEHLGQGSPRGETIHICAFSC